MGYTINQRYSVRREISGDGSSSKVLLVHDAQRGGLACALKLLRAVPDGDLKASRREFETLRALRHPLIAEVYDFGRVDSVEAEGRRQGDGEIPGKVAAEPPARPNDLFITFAYIDGLDLRAAYLRLFPGGLFPDESPAPPAGEAGERWRVFYEALADIGLGLHAIHSRGLVHHDVKPQNLLLVPLLPLPSQGAGQAPERFQVKIIDLDLALPETTPLGLHVRGTLPFIAPEVLSGAFADRRSDLYSLGISILWAIAGRNPFPGTSMVEVASAIRAGRLVDPAVLCPTAPLALLELVGRLVRLRPEERVPDALTLVSELERLGGISAGGRAASFRAHVPTVGWERELGLLAGEIEALAMGESERAAVIIETDAGQFVDQFLEEVESAAPSHGVKCVSGSARRPARQPYQPFAELIQKLIPQIDFSSERYQRFRNELSLFVPGVAGGAPLPRPSEPVRARWKFLDTVTEFLLEAGREASFILLLRDLGRCDAETLELVEFVARNIALRRRRGEDDVLAGPEAGGDAEAAGETRDPSRLLIVAEYQEPFSSTSTFVGEGAADAARHRATDGSRDGARGPRSTSEDISPLDRIAELAAQPYSLKIKLSPLGQERIGEWISRRAPHLAPSPKLVQRIYERSGGAPRLLDEIVRRLPAEASDEELEDVLSLPDNLLEAYQERLSRLPPDESRILDLLAVAHAPLSITVLAHAEERLGSPVETESGLAADLRRLEDEGFLARDEGRGAAVRWAVEPLRQQVYRQLPEERRVAAHRALFDALAQDGETSAADLLREERAFHAQRSGQLGRFIELALAAAQAYLRAYAAGPAIRLLEEVLEALGSGGEDSKEDLPRGLTSKGLTSDGLTSDGLRWSVHLTLAEVYQARRSFSRALEKYTILLSLEGGGGPDDRKLSRADIYRRMGEVYAENRDGANALFFLEKSLELLADQPPSRERARALLALAEFQIGRGQLQRAETAAERALDTLERLPAPELRSRTYSALAGLAARQNNPARGLAMNQKALQELEGGDDLERRAEITAAMGENYVARGDYEKAIAEFTRGIELSRAIGSKHAVASYQTQLGTIHFNRANHSQALDFFRKGLRLRRELGDMRGIANSYNNLGLVFRLRDDLTRAADCYKKSIDIFSRIDDQFGMAAGMNNLANILEMEGKYNEALDYSFRSLEKKRRSNSKSGVGFSYYRIGKIYQSKGELDKALAFAEKSLGIRREIGEKMGIAYSHLQLAELFLLSGRLFEAFQECQRGEKDFREIENDLGRMLAREILARILIQVGIFDEAEELLHETLDQAREGKQQLTVGAALVGLGRLCVEQGKLREAEAHLGKAEELFRENRNHREHAEALLERCALSLELGDHERASEILEDAYAILEELGIRDLVPRYFLLRGRIEGERPSGVPERARKFLERGLVESREVHLPDLSWHLHHRLAVLLRNRGELAAARSQAHEAEVILAGQFEPLPLRFKETFFRTRDRTELEKLVQSLTAGVVGETPPPDPVPADAATPEGGDGPIQQIRSLNKKLLKLQEVGQALSSELDLNRLLEKLMDAVLELVNAERGFVILHTPGSPEDTITVARNLDREMVDKPELKISRSICAEVIRSGQPVLSTSALEDDRFVESKSVHNLKLQSIICVPLLAREKVHGAVYLDNRLRRHAFDENDLQVLLTFSAQAAIAIANARLSEEIQARNRELTEANHQMEVLNQRLLVQVKETASELKAAQEHLRRREIETEQTRFHNLVGKSKRMQDIFHILDRISPNALPVLVMGESGTGKELIANAIHHSSTRRDRRFISENCAALSETLLESELFGHTRGAFTGAVAERKGLFELAHGGTLFLDEVGDMSLAMQKKLLRVLEEGEIRRVGGKDTIKVDARIISASNQNLRALVDAGKFREDLYYRLNGLRIELPALRDRKEDIPLLVQHFLEEIGRESRQPPKSISPEALRLLLSYDWPGNVRELRHFLERTVLLSSGSSIEERDCLFDPVIFRGESRSLPEAGPRDPDATAHDTQKLPLRAARDSFLKRYLERAYEEHGRNVSRAARACGISRESFHRLLKKHKLPGRERGAARGQGSRPRR